VLIPFLIIVGAVCWGSFLNVVGYRIIRGKSLMGRSMCPHCSKTIFWYDLIPLVSYAYLNGKCRHCMVSISVLYPLIEAITALSFFMGYYMIDPAYYAASFLFFSALIVTIRTDLETLLISQWTTLALVPFGILFSFIDMSTIYPLNSILGAVIGYLIPWLIGSVFYRITKKEGIGQGDFDLMALVGAFTGVIGVWATLFIGSLLGSFIGGIYLYLTGGSLRSNVKLPFGPFLALAAILYSLYAEQITQLLLGA